MPKARIALICGHRYGRRLASAMLTSAGLDFVHAFVLHPCNLRKYGGYESPISVLEQGGIKTTFFDKVGELETNQDWLRARPQFVFVVGLRQLLPVEMLWQVARDNRVPHVYSSRSGFIGFHPSDLPDGAGMAPVQWTIIEGAEQATVSAFFIDDVKIDGGPVISKHHFSIKSDCEAGDLDQIIGDNIADIFVELCPDLAQGQITFQRQADLRIPRRVRPQLSHRDSYVDFTETAEHISTQVRAFTKPYGGTAALLDDQAILIYKVEHVRDSFNLLPGQHQETSRGILVGCTEGTILIVDYEKL